MKICYIHNLYHPYAVGGAEQVVAELAAEARKRGDTPVIITATPTGSPTPKRTVEDGVIIYRFVSPNFFSYRELSQHGFLMKALWHVRDIWNRKSARIVTEILEEEKPDLVHTHNLMGIGFTIPQVIAAAEIRHRHTVHDVQLVEPSGVLAWDHTHDSWLQTWHSGVMKKVFAGVHEVLFPSIFMQRFYLQRGFFSHAQVSTVPPIVEAPVDRPEKTEHTAFLFVGSLVPHKGVATLLQVWEALKTTTDISVHIAGDGVLREYIDAWAQKDARIHVYGRLDREKVHELYAASDVLLFPSTCIENRPHVIVEAASHGLAIIASDTGGVSELLENTKNAWLVEPGNVRAWVDAVNAYLR